MREIGFYEKNRISNIVWTVTGAYGKEVDTALLEEEYFDYDLLYNGAVLGSLYATLDYAMVSDFIFMMKKSINLYKDILYLFFICVEETCVNQEIEFIGNMENIRRQNYKNIISELEMTPDKDRLFNNLRLCYYSSILKLPPVFDKNVLSLISQVKRFRNISSTHEFIEEFLKLLNRFFKFENENLKADERQPKKQLEKLRLLQMRKEAEIHDFFDMYISAEFNPNESVIETNFSKNSRVVNEREVEKNQVYNFQKMAGYYGEPFFDMTKTSELEKIYCNGIHEGHKLFFTMADKDTIKDDYRKSEIQDYVDANNKMYEKYKEYYENEIKKLKKIISEIMHSDETEGLKSSAGVVNSSVVYKAELMNKNRVFRKVKKNEVKSPVVDIVLDASASLLKKQSSIANQAYVVSRALQELGVQNSVTSFNNFMDYSIIKFLKTYEEKSCERIFDYYCSGGNRDGLAIDVIGGMHKEDENQKRLMIIFTDAKPYDVQVIHEIGQKAKPPYQGDVAVDDTARVLRRLKLNNLETLGIFSGEDENLQILRLIYGTDFLYIQDVDRFSDKVGEVLKKFIGI